MFQSFCRRNEIDILCLTEVGNNWSKVPRGRRLHDMFATETSLRTVTAHNIHESHGEHQYGGCAMLAFDTTATKVADTGWDPRGLGRWCWMLFKKDQANSTRIITTYIPCKKHKHHNETGAVYEQQRHHLRRQKITTCPRQLLIQDLKEAIIKWRAAGETVILTGDANGNTINGDLASALLDDDDPITDLLFRQHHDLPTLNTHWRGQQRIDGLWGPEECNILKGGHLPFLQDMGDHRPL